MVRKSNNSALNALINSLNTNMLPHLVTKAVVFDGATTNGIGDFAGTSNPYTLFTVTGTVAMSVIGVCSVNLASTGGGTEEVGTALTTAGLIAQTTATDIHANDIWHDATPDASIEAITILVPKIVAQDVILTTGTADVETGAITFYCMWAPLSADGNVE